MLGAAAVGGYFAWRIIRHDIEDILTFALVMTIVTIACLVVQLVASHRNDSLFATHWDGDQRGQSATSPTIPARVVATTINPPGVAVAPVPRPALPLAVTRAIEPPRTIPAELLIPLPELSHDNIER
jgi:hypothetical protein